MTKKTKSAPNLTETQRLQEISEEATQRARATGGTPEQQYEYYRAAYAGILDSLGIRLDG